MIITRRLLLAATALPGGIAARPAFSQAAFPTRPIRLIVPFPPAGTTDILARLIAEPLGRALGQTVAIENRAGAGGDIGADLVAKAEPDGHTLLMTTISTGAINNALYQRRAFKPEDLTGVSLVATVPNVMMVANALPVRTLRELVDLAKRRPGELTIGSSGNGTSLHMTGELFKLATGTNLVHVPFRGAGPMLTELIAGRIDVAVDNLPSSLGHIRDGRVRAIAITERQRTQALPEVPTTSEAGLPEVEATAWFGLQAPSRTPRPVVERIARELDTIIREPDMNRRIRDAGADPAGGTADQFERFIQAELVKWADVVRRAGTRIE